MCKMFEDFLMKITFLCLIIKITDYYISALLVFCLNCSQTSLRICIEASNWKLRGIWALDMSAVHESIP